MAQLKRVPGWIKRTRVPTRTTLRLSHHYHGRLCFPIPTRSILCRQAPSPPPWVRPVPLTWEVEGQDASLEGVSWILASGIIPQALEKQELSF